MPFNKVRMKNYNFEWSGSNPAADFVNTLDERLSSSPVERLDSYEALVEFTRQAQLVDNNTATRLLKSGGDRNISEIYSAALQLRAAVFDVLLALSAGTKPSADPVSIIENAIRRAYEARRLTLGDSNLTWSWRDPTGPARPLWELALAIESLLLSTDIQRIKKCTASDCGTIFIDNSKAGSRRWCSMSDCGNRSKVRKFRSSHRNG